jgi:hypothetical protein
VNGDGKLDLGAANYYGVGGSVSVLLGNGDGTFGGKADYDAGIYPQSLAIGDLNGDHKPDMVTVSPNSSVASVLLGNGDGTFAAKIGFGTGSGPTSVAIGDLNGDGKPDVVTANTNVGTVSVLINKSGGAAAIAMAFDVTPNTLNLASQGLWITGFLEPPAAFAASDIDASSIRLSETVLVDPAAPTAIGDHDGNGIPDLMVKFNRVAVELILAEGENVPVHVTGKLGARSFQGTDSIRVRHVPVSAPAAGSHLTAGSITQVRWQTPNGVRAESAALLRSFDGGATWSLITRGQPNTGTYDWTVPNVQTRGAKMAVVLAESSDPTGNLVDGLLGVSEAYSIDGVVGVGDGAPTEFALRGVTPNPALHELRVSFSLRASNVATLALFDVSGRQLESHRVEGMGSGWHTVTLGARSNLSAGLYLIRLTQEGRSLTTRAAVVR